MDLHYFAVRGEDVFSRLTLGSTEIRRWFTEAKEPMLYVSDADNRWFTKLHINFSCPVELRVEHMYFLDPLKDNGEKPDDKNQSGCEDVFLANGQIICCIREGATLPQGFWEALDAGQVPPSAQLKQKCVACRRTATAPVISSEYVVCNQCSPTFSYLLRPQGTPIYGEVEGRKGELWVPKALGGGMFLPRAGGGWRRALPSTAPGHEKYHIMVLHPERMELPEEHVVHVLVGGDYARSFPWSRPEVAQQILGRPVIAVVKFATKETTHHWADAFVGRTAREGTPAKEPDEILAWSTYSWGGGARTLPSKGQEREVDYVVAWSTTSTCIVYKQVDGKLEDVWSGWDS